MKLGVAVAHGPRCVLFAGCVAGKYNLYNFDGMPEQAEDAGRQGSRLVIEGRPDILVRFSQRGLNTAGCLQHVPSGFAQSI